ncbi:conjugal transfer protein TraV [Thiococcus pfennigii]|uniref:conjugal transfer protein TraV n=1 Tax=Thiococcus pfennigii TaxID=1057 RepID=UPI001904DCD9|nr:conjugal transfer protein TraV [Thiococcus pfennigii]
MSAAPALPLVLALTAILSGCAGIGKQDFACPGYPSKPLCLSTSEVYWLTDGDALPQATVRPRPIAATPRSGDQLFLETP